MIATVGSVDNICFRKLILKAWSTSPAGYSTECCIGKVTSLCALGWQVGGLSQPGIVLLDLQESDLDCEVPHNAVTLSLL